MELTGILLAGGKSSRMGVNKALLMIEGQTNIERMKQKLETVTNKLVLVTNEPEVFRFLQVPMIKDKKTDQGPLAGIEAGLSVVNNAWNLVVACDLPFFDLRVIDILVNKTKTSPKAQAIIPIIYGRENPLYALYHQKALPVVENQLRQGKRRIRDVLANLHVENLTEKDLMEAGMTMDEIELAFFNMNRPEDYNWVVSRNSL
ncbi:molybdenum cofactor guanylyltransferase [Salipaludibacillus keqinensis]|uniref:Probable molybdenum cofactor guanylyltransferase n=1 Tax=Salipaludibacillus keqinensis TaxID=2045207 RepID=A0A323TWB1_9BACI|nr:molybdenum cofactor guanylyltransferase [Salipaludibacillus keqinensis]PYZ93835.1 molybdenum cofactor guanylyltransferase [Salipaludibacillus keqinensis]